MPQHRQEGKERPVLKGTGNRSTVKANTFRALFCEKFQCASREFPRQLFLSCLHRHARPLAGIVLKMHPGTFREDFSFIADLATASSHAEVRMELDRFRGRNLRDRNWLRKSFSLRISGKRVLKLSRKLFVRHER